MYFTHHKIAKQVQAGHTNVAPLAAVRSLTKLCLSPVVVIRQVGQRPCLIFYFTWSGLNKAPAHKPPKEVMRFGGILQCIIQRVLMSDPSSTPVYLGKVDLANAYIRL